MTISERLFHIMDDKQISMPELARMTGISRHTIFDWQRRKTNPGADKIMIICEALQISPEELLVGAGESAAYDPDFRFDAGSFETQIITRCQGFSDAKKRRLLAYISMLENMKA